jgi:hypothetical protein
LRPCSATFLLILSTSCAPALVEPDGPERRRPDGVAVDPVEYPPDAADSAESSAGVVALRTPLGADAARDTTKSFLSAITREDLEGARATMSTDATTINPSTRARENAFYFYSRRFQRLDYFWLANVAFYQEDRVELFRADEAQSFWVDLVGPSASGSQATPSMNDKLEPSDVVVRVPISIPRVGSGALMADEITLLLRRSGGKYVIHRLVEDFALPP